VKIASIALAGFPGRGVVFALFFRAQTAESRGPNMKTYSAKPGQVEQQWFVVDATDKVLGRVAAEIAHRLRGKHKPEYTPHVDTGDYIVVVNADKVRVTGRKNSDKHYYRHSGYPGGIRSMSFDKLQAHDPGRVIKLAVRGMLPRNPLGRAMLGKLKVYAGAEHPHSAQQPQPLDI
jgi:large subunit ribosomal protein L13